MESKAMTLLVLRVQASLGRKGAASAGLGSETQGEQHILQTIGRLGCTIAVVASSGAPGAPVLPSVA